jgi:hypothetical protein
MRKTNLYCFKRISKEWFFHFCRLSKPIEIENTLRSKNRIQSKQNLTTHPIEPPNIKEKHPRSESNFSDAISLSKLR